MVREDGDREVVGVCAAAEVVFDGRRSLGQGEAAPELEHLEREVVVPEVERDRPRTGEPVGSFAAALVDVRIWGLALRVRWERVI